MAHGDTNRRGTAAGAWALWACVGFSALAHAQTASPLNDTGATRCATARGAVTTQCANKGQDASFGRDVTNPNPNDGRRGFSFVKVDAAGADLPASATQWSCVRDTVTGLMWEMKTDDGGLHDVDNVYYAVAGNPPPYTPDVREFPAAVNAVGLCGHADWRLPTRLELHSLVDYGSANTAAAIDLAWFPITAPTMHWTDQPPDGGYCTNCLEVSFLNGFQDHELGTTPTYPTRLVRGARLDPTARFVPDGEEVLDTYTGLTWLRCAEGMAWTGETCDAYAAGMTWPQAMNLARQRAQQTGLPWRLPDIKEIASLSDERPYVPSLNTDAFPGFRRGPYWSSTPNMRPFVDDRELWTFNFSGRSQAFRFDSSSGLLMLVRSAP